MITATFTTPFYTGVGSTNEVPGLFPIAIDSHPYLLDLQSSPYRPRFSRATISLLRSQADIGSQPTEASLNPDDLWRRTDSTWHLGTGQTDLDRADSQAARYHASKGIDPWTKYQLALLPDTASKRSSANTNLYLVQAGGGPGGAGRVYLTDGSTINASLFYTTDITAVTPTWTAVTGTPAVAPSGLASDGFNVWAAYGASGIYNTNTGTGAASSWRTGTVQTIGFVKGRLIVSNAQNLYDVSTGGGGALPAALNAGTNLPSSWLWVGFAEGPGNIYFAGFAGDKSLVYRTAVKSDGTALDVPVIAGELPDGEIVRSIQGYLGFLVIGSDKGVRFAALDGQGNLTLGQLIATGTSVRCFEPQDRFVWFGWSPYDSTSTGLGRLDLSVFTAPLTPAYASDLMTSGAGSVLSVVTAFQGSPIQELRVFTVSGSGVFAQSTNKVSSGTIDFGTLTYGIFDQKYAAFLDVRTTPIAGSYQAYISIDGGAFTSIGTSLTSDVNGRVFAVGPAAGRKFEIRLVLTRDATATTTGPTVTRTTLRSYPAPRRIEEFVLPVVLHEVVTPRGHQTIPMDVAAELNRLIQIIYDRRLVTLQLGSQSYNVLIEDYEFHPHHPTRDGSYWNGVCILRAKTVTE